MATVKKGMLSKSPEWWKHLRWVKKDFWSRERKAEQRDTRRRVADAAESKSGRDRS